MNQSNNLPIYLSILRIYLSNYLPTDPRINQSINHSINQSVIQSISINNLTNESIKQSAYLSIYLKKCQTCSSQPSGVASGGPGRTWSWRTSAPSNRWCCRRSGTSGTFGDLDVGWTSQVLTWGYYLVGGLEHGNYYQPRIDPLIIIINPY